MTKTSFVVRPNGTVYLFRRTYDPEVYILRVQWETMDTDLEARVVRYMGDIVSSKKSKHVEGDDVLRPNWKMIIWIDNAWLCYDGVIARETTLPMIGIPYITSILTNNTAHSLHEIMDFLMFQHDRLDDSLPCGPNTRPHATRQ